MITSEGANLRINVDDGKTTVDGTLKYKDGDAMAGKTPKVVAGAYTNSANPKPTATALYDIDEAGHLLSQAPPNDGVLNTIGMLGVKIEGPVAFNIVNKGEDNAAWLVTGGTLYSVDLKTGKATVGRQDRRRDRQAHRHRLDRLRSTVSKLLTGPFKVSPRKVGRLAASGGPLQFRSGPLSSERPQASRIRPSPS